MLIHDKVVVAPAGSVPLSVNDMKAHLNVVHDDDNAMIESFVREAIANFETDSGVFLRSQTREATFDGFPYWPDPLFLPYRPVTSIVSVKYFDTGDVEQTHPSTDYQYVEGFLGKIYAFTTKPWPVVSYNRQSPVTVRYVVGLVTVPDDILGALKIMVAERYAHRGDNFKSPAMPMAAGRVISLHSTATPG